MTKGGKPITKGEQACHHLTRVRISSLESKWWHAFLSLEDEKFAELALCGC
jgi:hypothetical protein